jgi:hypothetical protein
LVLSTDLDEEKGFLTPENLDSEVRTLAVPSVVFRKVKEASEEPNIL